MKSARWAAVAALGCLLAACGAMQFNLPAVSGGSDGRHLPGKVVWHDLLTDTPERTEAFYGALFGWEFEPLGLGGANYTLIRHKGQPIGGLVDQNQLPAAREDISQWVTVISVADIERAADAARAAGGRVLTPPTSLGERGDIAVVADAEGAVLALLQTRAGDPPDARVLPAPGGFLWDELWASDPVAARDFYHRTLGYAVELRRLDGDAGQLDYQVLSTGGRPRAGLRERPAPDLAPRWVNYLRMRDAAQLDAVLARVESLGGRILVPATDRPAGGRVAVIAGPSGAGIALQTWAEGQRLGTTGEAE